MTKYISKLIIILLSLLSFAGCDSAKDAYANQLYIKGILYTWNGTNFNSINNASNITLPIQESDVTNLIIDLAAKGTGNVSAVYGSGSIHSTGGNSPTIYQDVITSQNVTDALGYTPEPTITGGFIQQFWNGLKAWAYLRYVDIQSALSDVTVNGQPLSGNVSIGYVSLSGESTSANFSKISDTAVYATNSGTSTTTNQTTIANASFAAYAQNAGVSTTTNQTSIPTSLYSVYSGEATTANASAKLQANPTINGVVFDGTTNITVYQPNKAAVVYNSADISIPTGSMTYLTFNSEYYDSDNLHSTVANTGRLIAPITGVYTISGGIQFASGNSSARLLVIRVNGTNIRWTVGSPSSGSSTTYWNVTGIWRLNANDYIELGAQQNTGGNLSVQKTDYSPNFSMALVSQG